MRLPDEESDFLFRAFVKFITTFHGKSIFKTLKIFTWVADLSEVEWQSKGKWGRTLGRNSDPLEAHRFILHKISA